MYFKQNLLLRFILTCFAVLFLFCFIKFNGEVPGKTYEEALREFLSESEKNQYGEQLISDKQRNDSDFFSYQTAVPTAVLRKLIRCRDKENSFDLLQHGDFWLLKNYVTGSAVIRCFQSITYTTHSEFRYLENVEPLLERWQAPVSIAIYAPGGDFHKTLQSIAYLRKCATSRNLVVKFATFHIFFEMIHRNGSIPLDFRKFEDSYDCPSDKPYENVLRNETYKAENNLTYPVNVARNLARDAATTHFVLASDIELYPNPGVVDDFFKMIVRNPLEHLREKNVFVLPIFEVEENSIVPRNKSELITFFEKKSAIWFHHSFCSFCHMVPNAKQWIKSSSSSEMKIFSKSKRTDSFRHWEPLYIGTNREPFYDERLSWEDRKDKMTQAYIMCIQDYTFNVLSNAFLVHKPGIKTVSEAQQLSFQEATIEFFRNVVQQEMDDIYGTKEGCTLL